MHISTPYPKHTRFAHYDRAQPSYVFQRYPMTLQNDDGTSIVVQDEQQHRAVSGRRYDPDTYTGALTKAAAEKAIDGKVDIETPALPAGPVVDIPDNAKTRRGARMKNLDGSTPGDIVPGPEPEAQVQEAG
jgi:hypothetical protein